MITVNEANWRKVCAEKGVIELFEHYINCATEAKNAAIQFNSKMSVAIHLSGRPVISLHPLKSKPGNGLWIGHSRTNIGRYLPPRALPDGFENKEFMQGNNEWHFGFFNTKEAIEKLILEVF